MNVEQKPAATPHGRAVDAAHAKGKMPARSAGGADGAAEDGGFLSLLTSLGGDEGGGAEDALLPDAGAGAVSADPLASKMADAGDAAALQAVAAPMDAAAVPPLWASPEQMLQGRQLAEGVPGIDERMRAGEGAQVAAAVGAPAGRTPAHPAAVAADSGLKLGQEQALRDLPGPLGQAVSAQMQAAAPGRLAPRGAAEAMGGALSRDGVDPRSRAGMAEEHARFDLTSAVAVAVEQAQTVATVQPATTERRNDKASDPVGRMSGDAAWSQAALVSADAGDVSAGPAVGSPGMQVAEQVSYWIANDVQNAELKLDKFGNSPVEVSISLQGNEARVEFRSDLQEMRQVLQGAVTHLKDLLHSQGLVLAGVSVGTSGGHAAGQREQSPAARPNVRQATVAVPALAPLGGTSTGAQRSGRALDVFV